MLNFLLELSLSHSHYWRSCAEDVDLMTLNFSRLITTLGMSLLFPYGESNATFIILVFQEEENLY